ncbi:hypothetical protein PZA11_000470 [Diplocarpon coronariae]
MALHGSDKSGWLTSLVPSIVAQRNLKRSGLFTKPITYSKTARICFVQSTDGHDDKASTEQNSSGSKTEEKFPSENTSLPATSEINKEDLLSSLSKGMKALDINLSLIPDLIQTSPRCRETLLDNSASISPFNLTPLIHYGPLHFHRKPHKEAHNHDSLANLSPLAPVSRKYTVQDAFPSPASPYVIETDPYAHLPPSEPEAVSSLEIRDKIGRIIADPDRQAEYARIPFAQFSEIAGTLCDLSPAAEYRERHNPFPNVDLNEGWNRALCDGMMCVSASYLLQPISHAFSSPSHTHSRWHHERTLYNNDGVLGSMEEVIQIRRGFDGFSLWAQREAMEFDEEEFVGENGWGKAFDAVFKGEGLGTCWARAPGARRAKAGLLTCCRGVNFLEEIEHYQCRITAQVQEWRERNEEWPAFQKARKSMKRKWKYQRGGWRASEDDGRRKRVRYEGVELHKVLTKQWRARRIEQERRAGRWTDGTLRQYRLWAEFHWVLNEFWSPAASGLHDVAKTECTPIDIPVE